MNTRRHQVYNAHQNSRMSFDNMMRDDNSVSTQVASNVSTRRMFLHRWGPPLLVFVFGAILISKDRNNKPLVPSAILRTLNDRRELYSPYDTSTNIELPEWTTSLANVWEPVEEKQTPLFWSIPKAGGDTISQVFSNCLGLTLASNKGLVTSNTTLGVYEREETADYPHPARYVNVKTNSETWIQKCKERGLLESGLADVVTTQHLTYAASNLFTDAHRGRAFVMMRHPVKRAIDHFLSRQQTAEDEALSSMTLVDFVDSDQLVENYEVRMLNGITNPKTPITENHLSIAKEVLRRKFLVGIFEWFDVGMVRFEKHFGWWKQFDVLNNLTINDCHYSIIESGENVYAKAENGEYIYTKILRRSWADVELYRYAKFLFAEQAKLI